VTLIEQERSAPSLTSVRLEVFRRPQAGNRHRNGRRSSVAAARYGAPSAAAQTGCACMFVDPCRPNSGNGTLAVARMHEEAVIFETTSSKVGPQDALRLATGGRPSFGLHPLFDSSARTLDGQTVFITPSSEPQHQQAHLQLTALIGAQGGTVRVGTPAEHDHLMEYVQALPHKVLLLLLDVLVLHRSTSMIFGRYGRRSSKRFSDWQYESWQSATSARLHRFRSNPPNQTSSNCSTTLSEVVVGCVRRINGCCREASRSASQAIFGSAVRCNPSHVQCECRRRSVKKGRTFETSS